MNRPAGAYRFVQVVAFTLLRLYFRRLQADGTDHIPSDRGGLLVAWHPNGIIDPALIMAFFPGSIAFGARKGLFDWPVIGPLMRAAGAIPIYRTIDNIGLSRAEQRDANLASLDLLASRVANGSYSALFPEGVSHDEPHLMEVKTGAARLYYRARELSPRGRPPAILPVGIEYDSKHVFRSTAVVRFHPPIDLPDTLDSDPSIDTEPAAERQKLRDLTTLIEETLEAVSHTTETWELRSLMSRTARLMRAESIRRTGKSPGSPDPLESDDWFSRVWNAYRFRSRSDPAAVADLRQAIKDYDIRLRDLRLEDHELDAGGRIRSLVAALLLLAQIVVVYLVMPVLIVAGYVLNAVPFVIVSVASALGNRPLKDAASIKVLGGAVAYPLTWTAAGVVASMSYVSLHEAFPSIPDTPIWAGVVVAALGFVGGLVALWWSEMLGNTMRSARTSLTRRRYARAVAEMREIRSRLYDRLVALAEPPLSTSANPEAEESK